MLKRHSSQSGQIGIIIILIMVVLLTVGLSVASQSTQEAFLSNQEDESTRVFNAAEAGVEQALSTDLAGVVTPVSGSTTVTGSNASVNYTINPTTVLETRVPEGGTATVKLADPASTPPGSPAVPQVSIQWARETACGQNPASLILEIFSYDATKNPKTTVRYMSLNPAPCANHYNLTTDVNTGGSNGYFRQYTFNANATDVLIRIKPQYNDTSVKVQGSGASLPIQGYSIRSTATNNLGTSNETRSVEVNRTLSMAPSIFDYVLFSGTSIVK